MNIQLDLIDLCLLIFCTALWIELRAMKMSTHKVQFVDPWKGIEEQQESETPFDPIDDRTKENLKKEYFDNIV